MKMKIEKAYLKTPRKKADPSLEPRIRKRIQVRNGTVESLYVHFVYDPITKKKFNRSVTFGNKITKIEAYKIIMKWRRAKIKEIQLNAKEAHN